MRAKRLLMVSLVLAAACKPPTPAEEMDSVLSWIGTAGMAGDAWLRHSTPDTYTRQTLELSGETLQQISKDLLESPPPAVDSATLDGVLTRTRDRITRMAGLIKAKDAPDFARQLDSLRADQKAIKALADSIESKQ
ncbi:MAG TPA: hypothetical protein VGO75_05005 [Gemmatimonadaceae bacterium]|nr:hypothetical protein [Gemmatimonadaceae bacterium]